MKLFNLYTLSDKNLWTTWNNYVAELNSNANSLLSYWKYFNPDWRLLNDTLKTSSGDIEPLNDQDMFIRGYKAPFVIFDFKDGEVPSLGLKDSSQAKTDYIIENAAWVTDISKINEVEGKYAFVFSPQTQNHTGVYEFYTKIDDKWMPGVDKDDLLLKNIESSMMYFPRFLDFREGFVNTDNNSYLFYGGIQEWIFNNGSYREGPIDNTNPSSQKIKFYAVAEEYYRQMFESPEILIARLINDLNVGDTTEIEDGEKSWNLQTTAETFQFQSATDTINLGHYPWTDFRLYDEDSGEYIYFFNEFTPLDNFPSSSLIFSVHQVVKSLNNSIAAERANPENYVILPRSFPSVYTLSIQDRKFIYQYKPAIDEETITSLVFTFSLYPNRYNFYNDSVFNKNNIIPVYAYRKDEITGAKIPYIANATGAIWSNETPLLSYLYKEDYNKNDAGQITSFTREDFFGEETVSTQLRTIDGEGVMTYTIQNSQQVNLQNVWVRAC